MKQDYQIIPIHYLKKGRYQPRVHFDEKALAELAESINQQGLIEPVIVREIHPTCYEIIAGERRWRAAQQAGLTQIPCLIGLYNDKQAASLGLIENLQREQLNIIEEAQGYKRLLDEFHFNQEEIANKMSKSRSHIANILRLLQLSPCVQDLLKNNTLSFGHARVLIGLNPALQFNLAQRAVKDQWSVRRMEEAVSDLKKQSTALSASPDIHRLETQLADQLGAPVKITSETNTAGWLKIKFFDNDTLTGILERLGLDYD